MFFTSLRRPWITLEATLDRPTVSVHHIVVISAEETAMPLRSKPRVS
jgi:hypothetical protein